MTVRRPSHTEDLEQIDRYERIAHALVRNGMDPNLVDKVILTSTLSEMIAAIDRLDKTLRETDGTDGDGDRNTRAIPRRHPSLVERYLERRNQRRVL